MLYIQAVDHKNCIRSWTQLLACTYDIFQDQIHHNSKKPRRIGINQQRVGQREVMWIHVWWKNTFALIIFWPFKLVCCHNVESEYLFVQWFVTYKFTKPSEILGFYPPASKRVSQSQIILLVHHTPEKGLHPALLKSLCLTTDFNGHRTELIIKRQR